MSGEMMLAIGVGLALVVSGALAWWGTVRSFSKPRPGSSHQQRGELRKPE